MEVLLDLLRVRFTEVLVIDLGGSVAQNLAHDDVGAAQFTLIFKLELEYEGELRGADIIVREILRNATAKVYDKYFSEANTQQIEQYFHLGGTLQFDDTDSSAAVADKIREI